MSKKIKLGKGNEFLQITLREFIKALPPKSQQERGKVNLDKDRIRYLKSNLEASIDGSNGVVCLAEDRQGHIRVVSGNHRQAAVKEAIEDGIIDDNYQIPIIFLKNKSDSSISKSVYLSNQGHQRKGRRQHMIKSDLPFPKKVNLPIFKALNNTEFAGALSKSTKEKIALYLGALLDNISYNKKGFLVENKFTIFGSDIVEAKNSKSCSNDWFDAIPNIDLRNDINELTVLLEQGMEAIYILKELTTRDKGKFRAAIEYTLIGASLSGMIDVDNKKNSSVISRKSMEKLLKDPKKKGILRDLTDAWTTNPGKQQEGILRLLMGKNL